MPCDGKCCCDVLVFRRLRGSGLLMVSAIFLDRQTTNHHLELGTIFPEIVKESGEIRFCPHDRIIWTRCESELAGQSGDVQEMLVQRLPVREIWHSSRMGEEAMCHGEFSKLGVED